MNLPLSQNKKLKTLIVLIEGLVHSRVHRKSWIDTQPREVFPLEMNIPIVALLLSLQPFCFQLHFQSRNTSYFRPPSCQAVPCAILTAPLCLSLPLGMWFSLPLERLLTLRFKGAKMNHFQVFCASAQCSVDYLDIIQYGVRASISVAPSLLLTTADTLPWLCVCCLTCVRGGGRLLGQRKVSSEPLPLLLLPL